MKKRWVCLLTLLVLLMCPLARADFGGISGDVGYVSSGYDVDTSYSTGSSGIFLPFGNLLVALFMFGFLYLLVNLLRFICKHLTFLVQRLRGQEPSELLDASQGVDVSYLEPVSQLKDFDEAKLLSQIPAIYLLLQKAWAAGDLTPVQPLLTIPYYAQMCDKLQEDYLDNEITSHLEQVEVLDVQVLGCLLSHCGAADHLYLSLRTRFVNYLTDAQGAVLHGDKSAKVYMHYEWDMERRRDSTAAFVPDGDAAPAAVDCDWIISQIKGISKRTRRY